MLGIGLAASIRRGTAFLANVPRAAPSTAVTPSAAASAATQTSWRRSLGKSSVARFMSTDAAPAAGEKTEEEKAAIKAAREARK